MKAPVLLDNRLAVKEAGQGDKQRSQTRSSEAKTEFQSIPKKPVGWASRTGFLFAALELPATVAAGSFFRLF